MAVNLSLFEGVPTKLSVAKKQFKEIYRRESFIPFSRGRWLVLKKEKSGKYKGYYGTYIYETKPKGRFLMKRRIPK